MGKLRHDLREAGKHAAREVAPRRVRRFFGELGPGLITGAADDDPSGIGTYSMAGASLGFATLWTAILTFPLMSAIQFLCAKIGMVSGMGLAGVLRRHYSRAVQFPKPSVRSAVWMAAKLVGWAAVAIMFAAAVAMVLTWNKQ